MLNKIFHFTPLEKKNADEKKSPDINRSSFFDSLTGFIKYNNATVIILAIILILGGGALAAGPEAIGEKQTSIQGLDNTALLAADLGAFNLDFKIENIQQDESYYYVTYSFLDLALANNAWQYQLSRKTQKVSQKIKEDLGVYLAKFLAKHYEARVRELKQEKTLAESQGVKQRIEVTEYSGLIGRTLDLAAKVFPGYEPVVKRELPAPAFAQASAGRPDLNFPPLIKGGEGGLNSAPASGVDNLNKIYNDYVAAHPEVFNSSVAASSTPAESADAVASSTPPADNPPSPLYQGGTDGSPAPSPAETPASSEPKSVDIIELPAQ